MTTIQKRLRMSQDIVDAIEETAESTERDFSAVANEMLAEAVKMRRCPGISFVDGPTGRRAKIEGTGLDVWEVIAGYKSVDLDWNRFREAYHWLEEFQLRAALDYHAAYPDEIDERIAENESWTRERVAKEYPFLLADRA